MTKEKLHWTRWYYGISHLQVDRGGSAAGGSDVATVNRFPSGGCTLRMYNTHGGEFFPEEYYPTVAEAMALAEKRLGVKGIPPSAGLPKGCPSNPPECR